MEKKQSEKQCEDDLQMSIINIDECCLMGKCSLTMADSFILEKWESYLWKYGIGNSLVSKISNFLSMAL